MEKSQKNYIDPVEAARKAGIDITMLEDNLKRPIIERIRRHQNALNMYLKFRKAKHLN